MLDATTRGGDGVINIGIVFVMAGIGIVISGGINWLLLLVPPPPPAAYSSSSSHHVLTVNDVTIVIIAKAVRHPIHAKSSRHSSMLGLWRLASYLPVETMLIGCHHMKVDHGGDGGIDGEGGHHHHHQR